MFWLQTIHHLISLNAQRFLMFQRNNLLVATAYLSAWHAVGMQYCVPNGTPLKLRLVATNISSLTGLCYANFLANFHST